MCKEKCDLLNYIRMEDNNNNKEIKTKKSTKKWEKNIILKNDGHNWQNIHPTHTLYICIWDLWWWLENENIRSREWISLERCVRFDQFSLSLFLSHFLLHSFASPNKTFSLTLAVILHQPLWIWFHFTPPQKERKNKRIVVAPPNRIWSSSTIF